MTMYVIPGNPIALPRARSSRRGFYDPAYKAKTNLQWYFKETYPNHPLYEAAISLEVTFYMPIPKSISKKKHQLLIGQPHTKTKDLDNNLKFLCDALNEILWKDDALIWSINAKKIYGEEPRTEFTIKENL